jgi:hypothetical protein
MNSLLKLSQNFRDCQRVSPRMYELQEDKKICNRRTTYLFDTFRYILEGVTSRGYDSVFIGWKMCMHVHAFGMCMYGVGNVNVLEGGRDMHV